MLGISVVLYPATGGDPAELTHLTITNTGDHPQRPARGRYDVRELDAARVTVRTARVADHDRREGPWVLVAKALAALGYAGSPGM